MTRFRTVSEVYEPQGGGQDIRTAVAEVRTGHTVTRVWTESGFYGGSVSMSTALN